MKTNSLILISVLAFACGDDASNTTPGDDAHPLDGTCEPIAGASSYAIIDAAFTSGALSLETSLAYKAFAEFGDPRLPAECLGDDTEVTESQTLDDIYEHWATLSPDAQGLLEPFLIPPAYVGSWSSLEPTSPRLQPGVQARPPLGCTNRMLDSNWDSVPNASTSSQVKVWYDKRIPGQASLAQTLLTAAESEIWPKLVGTLGMRAPLSDNASPGCNGGDGAFDIYLSDMVSMGQNAGDFGTNLTSAGGWTYQPTFLLIRNNLDAEKAKASLAHEFMHASQWAYPVAGIALGYSYPWLKEATAQWAIDYVYPTAVHNFEQLKVPYYIAQPDEPVNTRAFGSGHIYGSYLFFLFLTKTLQPSVIKDIWEKTTTVSDELEAVDQAIPGGFKDKWPKFAKALWNRDPVETSSFETWDAMPYPVTVAGGGTQDLTLAVDVDVKVGGAASGNLSAILETSGLKHLSSRYFKLKFPADATTRSVAFSAPDNFLSVQAFIQKTGSPFHVWEDWSGGNVVKRFCIDVTAERLTELVIVLSNDSIDEDLELIDLQKPRLLLSSVGCWKYQGTTSIIIADGSYTQNVTTNVTLDVDTGSPFTNDYFLPFKVNSGTANADEYQTNGACTFTTTAAGAMTTGTAGGTMDINLGFDFGAGSIAGRQISSAQGTTNITTTTTIVCTGPPSSSTTTSVYPWDWLRAPMLTKSVSPDGSIHLDVTEPYNTGTRRLVWDLAPLRQP